LGHRKALITFDGGSLGNPGKGYGSYVIEGLAPEAEVVRLDFSPNGEIVSNNQAEYRTLIAALTELASGPDSSPATTDLEIRGDSLLVIEQLAGRWKVKHPEIRLLHQAASHLVMSPFSDSVTDDGAPTGFVDPRTGFTCNTGHRRSCRRHDRHRGVAGVTTGAV
jgi:ribonuclease HI